MAIFHHFQDYSFSVRDFYPLMTPHVLAPLITIGAPCMMDPPIIIPLCIQKLFLITPHTAHTEPKNGISSPRIEKIVLSEVNEIHQKTDRSVSIPFYVSSTLLESKEGVTYLNGWGAFIPSPLVFENITPLFVSLYEKETHFTPAYKWIEKGIEPPKGGMIGSERIEFPSFPLDTCLSVPRYIQDGHLAWVESGHNYHSIGFKQKGAYVEISFQRTQEKE